MRGVVLLAFFLATGSAAAQEVASASGAVLRALDKVSGITEDIDLASGSSTTFGALTISLSECRYPAGDPSANAFAHVTIRHGTEGAAAFEGWMVSSSPALSALDDPRYDVWVLRCKSE